jgi:hypothetical protein
VSVIAAPSLCEGRLYVVGAKSKKLRGENCGDGLRQGKLAAAMLRPYMTSSKF